MLSFRQKILISYVFFFIIFIALVIPFASSTVKKIASKAMQDRTKELIEKIQTAPNNDALIRRLKEQKSLIFFRISVITDERKVLYDSHTKQLLGPRFSQEYVVDHPEVLEAFESGLGYSEDYSELLGQKFSYFAKSFDFHDKTYIMRTAFPYKYVVELTHDFELGFISLVSLILLLFSLFTWFIINYLTQPIAQIISAITPYSKGEELILPEITVRAAAKDEFSKLALTLNSLSAKLQKQITTLTQERNEKKAILESLIEGVIATDQEMIITYANQTALKLLKFEAEEIIGKHIDSLQHHKCLALLMTCQTEQHPLVDTLILSSEGPSVYLNIVAAPKKDNKGAILVLQDQTSHYRILEMRKDFVANASHELKTPITIIRGFAETLHDHPDLSEEIRVEVTGKIVRNCLRMTTLIKDLLILSDIENIPESRLEKCKLIKLINNCVETVLTIYPDTIIQVTDLTAEEDYLIADVSLMDLALINLIENAAKYSAKPARITITLEKNGAQLKVTIADCGIGIPKQDIEFIFEKFYTVDKAHSQKMGGSGLGLSIVKTIIEKHQGKISVASELKKGTTFTLLFPLSSI